MPLMFRGAKYHCWFNAGEQQWRVLSKLRPGSGPWRRAAWVLAAAIMLVPVSVQLFSGNFGWSIFDFIGVAIILLAGCLIFDFTARRAPNLSYLAGAGAALAAGFGSLVVNGAVGLVGSEDEPHNLLFLFVLIIAIGGAAIAEGRPSSMARAMFTAALTHVFVSVALVLKARGISDGDPQMEVVGLAMFAGIWLASGWLFQHASKSLIH